MSYLDQFARIIDLYTPEVGDAETAFPVVWNAGLAFTATSQLMMTDVSGGLPEGTTWQSGLPISRDGYLCVDAYHPVTHYHQGVGFTSTGGVSVPTLGSSRNRIQLEDVDQLLQEDGNSMNLEDGSGVLLVEDSGNLLQENSSSLYLE